MKIIMLSGKAKSGKDQFFKFAEKVCNCQRYSIGEAMKIIAKIVFNWDGSKEGEKRWVLIDIANILRGNYENVDKEDYPIRKLYKFVFLHNVLKTLYNPYKDFWTDIVIKKIKEDVPEITIVTDWRLVSEYDAFVRRFNRQDIITVRINRNVEKIDDKTEKDLDYFNFDYTIDNDGLLKEYEDKVIDFIKDI